MFLRKLVQDQLRKSLELLPLAELWHNWTFNVSIKMTPLMALYGWEAATFNEIYKGDSTDLSVEKELLRRQEQIEMVKFNMDRTRD